VTAGRAAVGAVWALVALGTAGIVALLPGDRSLSWLALVLGLGVVAGMAAQLVVGEQRGFVVRLSAAAAGSAVLVAVGALTVLAGA